MNDPPSNFAFDFNLRPYAMVALVSAVLKACSVGDLLALTLTEGDGGGQQASGEKQVAEAWPSPVLFFSAQLEHLRRGAYKLEWSSYRIQVGAQLNNGLS